VQGRPAICGAVGVGAALDEKLCDLGMASADGPGKWAKANVLFRHLNRDTTVDEQAHDLQAPDRNRIAKGIVTMCGEIQSLVDHTRYCRRVASLAGFAEFIRNGIWVHVQLQSIT
jgi:hypothetical protein